MARAASSHTAHTTIPSTTVRLRSTSGSNTSQRAAIRAAFPPIFTSLAMVLNRIKLLISRQLFRAFLLKSFVTTQDLITTETSHPRATKGTSRPAAPPAATSRRTPRAPTRPTRSLRASPHQAQAARVTGSPS